MNCRHPPKPTKKRKVCTEGVQKAKFPEARRNAQGCRGELKGGFEELGTGFWKEFGLELTVVRHALNPHGGGRRI